MPSKETQEALDYFENYFLNLSNYGYSRKQKMKEYIETLRKDIYRLDEYEKNEYETRISISKQIVYDIRLYRKALDLATRPVISSKGYNDMPSKKYYLELARKELENGK